MSAAMVTCARCGMALDQAALRGLCPRCVALAFFAPAGSDRLDPKTPPLEESERRVGDYELLEEIARGGMGIVYRARQLSLDREVAVKMILHGVLAGDTAIARFKAEATAAAGLRHANIVAIHETGEHQGRHFFSMEFVTGRTLTELARDGPVLARVAARYLQLVAAAVHYAHERGVLHRDLKPSNVLIDEDDQPRVSDFGLAKRFGDDSDLTLTGQVLGTPAYMSPEQAGGAKFGVVDARTDVYSLGAVLYHLVTGRAPFTGEAVTEILRQVTDAEPVAPRLLRPGLPRDLETICLKCLAKEPPRRYGTAQEMAEDLGRFLRDEPIRARPVTAAEKLWRWRRREPALAASLAVCGVVLAGGVAGIYWQLRQTEVARREALQTAGEEKVQRHLAEGARQEAEHNSLVTRQNLYAADMLGAQRALADGDLGTARLLLEAHRPKAGQSDLRGFEWRYFWGQTRGESFATLADQGVPVSAVAFSADGKWLAFGSQHVLVCDATSLQARARAEVPNVESIAFIPHTQSMLIGTRGTDVRRWDWGRSGDPPLFMDAHGRWPNVVISPAGDVLAVGCGADPFIGDPEGGETLYDAATGAPRQALPESGGLAAFSPDGKLLATGSWRGKVKLWNPRNGESAGALTNANRVISLKFSPDGQTLAVCSFVDGLWLYDLATGTRQAAARGHSAYVTDAAFSPNGATLATASPDQTVRLWELKTGRETACFRGHSYQVGYVAWSPDGKTLASGGNDGTVRLWKVESAMASNQPLAGWVKSRFFSADGRWLASANADGRVTIHGLPGMNVAGGPYPAGLPLGFLPDSKVLVTLVQKAQSETCEIARWTVPDFQTLEKIPLPESAGRTQISCALSPDGRWAAGGGAKDELLVWDLSRGAGLRRLPMPDAGRARALVFSPDSRLLAGAFENSTSVWLWDLATGRAPAELPGHRGPVVNLVFSPDGRTLISGERDKLIKMWDVPERKELATLSGHRGGIVGLAVSPDGKTLASSSGDQTLQGGDRKVRLWNLVTRREVAEFDTATVADTLAFAPDGSALFISHYGAVAAGPSAGVWRAPGFAETDALPESARH